MSGTLYGIGVGPGDPELLTAKAIRLLGALPVLAWPAPMDGDGMARKIAAEYIPPGRVEIPIRLGFRPERDDTDAAYGAAAAAIAGHLEQGCDVGVLCEGDPMFFGSFIYLMTRLAPRFPVQVVPGISSVMAGAAALQRPIATLDDAVAIIPATIAEEKLEAMLAAADSAVIMKVGRHLPKVRRVLDRLGLAHAWLAERIGHADQRLCPLAQAETAPYFSLILVHRASS